MASNPLHAEAYPDRRVGDSDVAVPRMAISVQNMNSWKQKAQRMRVPAGTVMGIVFRLLMHPSEQSLWIGGIISLIGTLLRLWASGHIVKGRVLTRSGPYAFSRNPLYLGSFIMALGVIIGGQGYWLIPVFVLFFPRIRPSGYPVSGFLWARVSRNREYRSILGWLLVEAILILEYLLF